MLPALRGASAQPVLDREGFEQLLAAAYVLQQHRDRLSRKDPRLQGTPSSDIRELRSLVTRRDLDLRTSASLIAERLRVATRAEGVSISVVDDGSLESIASAGVAARVPGGAISANCLVATERLRAGKLFHSRDAEKDVRLDLALCRETRVRSLLAVPIEGREGVGGLIELRSSHANAFRESEEASCWWMAGLMRELRDQDSHPANVSSEPSPLDAQHFFRHIRTSHGGRAPENSRLVARSHADGECPVCGRPFRADEAYCGNCSLPRVAAAPAKNLQSKWASMWFRRRAQETLKERLRAQDASVAQPASPPPAPSRQPFFLSRHEPEPAVGEIAIAQDPEVGKTEEESSPEVEPDKLDFMRRALANFRQALRQAFQDRALKRRIRRLLLPSAVIVLLVALFLWRSPEQLSSELGWFQSLLVQVGLEPAQTPAFSGSPDVRVWVDAHTALYYCPGSSLYGKTPGGHFSTQRAAQRDQIEPATRIPCW